MRKISFVFLLSLRHDQDKKIFHFVVTFTTACEEKRSFFFNFSATFAVSYIMVTGKENLIFIVPLPLH